MLKQVVGLVFASTSIFEVTEEAGVPGQLVLDQQMGLCRLDQDVFQAVLQQNRLDFALFVVVTQFSVYYASLDFRNVSYFTSHLKNRNFTHDFL